MFFVGALLCVISFVVMLLVLIGTFSALPEGRYNSLTGKYVANFTYLLRKGAIGKLVYWAAPIIFMIWLTLFGGMFYLVACFAGYHANRKYRLLSSTERKRMNNPPPAVPTAYTPSGGDGL